MTTNGPSAHQVLDAASFAANAERITNHVLTEEWLELYAPDAVAEWIVDGAYERHEGIEAVRAAVLDLAALWRKLGLHVRKTVECADHDTIVISWTGGFGGSDRQFGTEIWTLREGLVIRHQMYAYLDVRPSTSLLARLRLTATAPRVALALLAQRRSPTVTRPWSSTSFDPSGGEAGRPSRGRVPKA